MQHIEPDKAAVAGAHLLLRRRIAATPCVREGERIGAGRIAGEEGRRTAAA